jgi:putative endopeptidase
MRNPIALSLAAVAASLLAGCGTASPEPVTAGPSSTGTSTSTTVVTGKPAGPPAVATTLANVGLDASAIDRTADPCKDFYQYACGGWLAKTEIPADEARWVRSFNEIDKHNETELKRILEQAAKAKTPEPLTKKIGDYYGACMDEPAVEAAGAKPIADLLAKAKKVKDAKTIGALVTELHARRIFPIFDISGDQDFGDATKIIAQLDQAGLGLPDRDYYVKEDDKSKAIRAEYVAHVERMMKLAGYPEKDAKQAAADAMNVETELAKVSKTRVERRDPKGLYNKINRDGIAKTTPAFPWDDYFKGLGIAEAKEVNVTSVPFFEGVNKLLGSIKAPAWQNYLAWQVVHSTAGLLSKSFVDEAFKLQAMLTGQKEIRPRWKRCVDATDGALGELVAQPFIQANFAGESKKAAEEMVQQISAAFARGVDKLDWMDAKTKARAQEKRKMMAYLIGYPSKWRSYDFPVDPKAYAQNALASGAFEQKRRLSKIGKPLDREEWQMSPPTVNAYYDPQKNHMVFPAGILQPPFYSVKAGVAVNLGAIGMVVGHELTHGFDDQGAQFAGNGNLENWWEPQVGAQFKAKTGCVDDQFSRYEPLPGLKLNGKLTLGENIADLGGIKLAFSAYREMRKNAAETYVADGFSEDQQFFLSLAQSWCGKSRDELTRLRVQVDPHSPPRFRVIGPASNLSEFAEAFSCSPGTPMRPTKVCTVW